MLAVQRLVQQVAGTDATVLILGESGVGKDLVAVEIHRRSERRHGPLVRVNCAALPSELMESELFGHQRGAFTGAHEDKPGKFELAAGGTLVLDEIAELPQPLQAKLLHVLQDREYYRVGARELVRADCRVIASTNRDLMAAIARGEFREDLFYRLNVIEIRVPPLRERREEIPRLAQLFLDRFNRQYDRQVRLDGATLVRLQSHDFPGNVRELENLVRRLVVLADGGRGLEPLLDGLGSRPSPGPSRPATSTAPATLLPSVGLKEIARQAARDAEHAAVREVLERVRWNRARAARLLGVSAKTLRRKMAELGVA